MEERNAKKRKEKEGNRKEKNEKRRKTTVFPILKL